MDCHWNWSCYYLLQEGVSVSVCAYTCEPSAQYSPWCISSGEKSRMSGSADEKSILILKEKDDCCPSC